MPILSNARHERFAQEIAKGASATEAYRAAGYTPDRKNAARLTSKDDVAARIAEIQARAAGKAEVTLQWLMEEAQDVLAKAKNEGQYAPAVSAIKELGILSGIRVEKRENTNRSLTDMSDDELAEVIRTGHPKRMHS